MQKTIVLGEGVQGINLLLSIGDMSAASNIATKLQKTLNSMELKEKYDKTPYDKRKEEFPEGQPKVVELDKETVSNLLIFMRKISAELHATIFDDVDDEEEELGIR